MAKYKLSTAAVIDDRFYEAGEEVEHAGIPGWHMEPLDAEAKRAFAAIPELPALDPDKLAGPGDRIIPGRPHLREAIKERRGG